MQVESVLQQVEETEFHFLKLKDEAEETDVSLEEAKEHFSRLKLEYQDLEARQQLLEILVKKGARRANQDTQKLQHAVKETKSQITAVKKEMQKLKEELHDTIAKVVPRWRELQIQKMEFVSNYDQENTARNKVDTVALKERNAKERVYGKVDPKHLSLLSEEDGAEVIKAQRSTIQQLSEEIEKMQATIETMEQNLVHRQPTLNNAEMALRQQEKHEDEQAPRNERTRRKMIWAEELRQVFSYIHGFELLHAVEAEPHTLRIAFKKCQAQMRIELNRDNTRMIAASLDQNDKADISDIVAYALQSQSLPFLIREVQNRLEMATLSAYANDPVTAASIIVDTINPIETKEMQQEKTRAEIISQTEQVMETDTKHAGTMNQDTSISQITATPNIMQQDVVTKEGPAVPAREGIVAPGLLQETMSLMEENEEEVEQDEEEEAAILYTESQMSEIMEDIAMAQGRSTGCPVFPGH